MKKEKIRFAIIGLGNIGVRHAKHIEAHPDAHLVSVCDIRPEVLSFFEPSKVQLFDNLYEMLLKGDFDVLSVCTPNVMHAPHTIAALRKGYHVICEKPMATRSEDSAQMILEAEKAQRTIFVVKQNRYNEPVQQVKQLLQQGILGKPYLINVNCFWNRNADYYQESSWRGTRMQDGGCLFTQFSHFVDILYYLFGPVQTKSGMVRNFAHPYTELEDSGVFLMETATGALVNFNFSTCSYEKNLEGAFTILAENGAVKIGGQYLNTIEYQQIEGHVIPDIQIQAKANDYGKYQGSMSNHDQMIQNVIQTLRGEASIMTSAAEGHEVVRIIESMYASVLLD